MASRKKGQAPSQLSELFIAVANALGFESDRDVASLASVLPVNVANWKSGAVREFKAQTLEAIKRSLTDNIRALREHVDLTRARHRGVLHPLIIESGSGPDELLRQFRNHVTFDYLGHRFLYYEPQGALAWLNLISTGYDQPTWLRGTELAAAKWLERKKDRHGRAKGAIARGAWLDRRGPSRGMDVIGLGCGDGAKEVAVLRQLLKAADDYDWMTFAPVDVSIPLLLRAATSGRDAMDEAGRQGGPPRYTVLPFCADFEEGPLSFLGSLRTDEDEEGRGLRLILLLGNIFGNLRDEDRFIREKLWTLARPGDLVWLEIATRLEPLSSDPLYRITVPQREETAAEANRRLLLSGPFRRWEAATGRPPAALDLRVWVREDDDASRIPGSCNFCHDLVFKAEGRVCTMLYSRRYRIDGLVAWLEQRGFSVERLHAVRDPKGRERVVHILLRRT